MEQTKGIKDGLFLFPLLENIDMAILHNTGPLNIGCLLVICIVLFFILIKKCDQIYEAEQCGCLGGGKKAELVFTFKVLGYRFNPVELMMIKQAKVNVLL